MTHDSIHRPAHYAEGRIYEPIAVIEDWDLNYRLGSVVKYVSRAGRKQNALEDLKKARWYLDREIDQLELNQEPPTDYEQVLTFYGQTQDDAIAWPDYDGSGFDALIEPDNLWGAAQPVPFETGPQDTLSFPDSDDWEDFWSDFGADWGPVELSKEEVDEVLNHKDLDKFQEDEIVSTFERRGFVFGVKKDGSSCLLNDRGRCG